MPGTVVLHLPTAQISGAIEKSRNRDHLYRLFIVLLCPKRPPRAFRVSRRKLTSVTISPFIEAVTSAERIEFREF